MTDATAAAPAEDAPQGAQPSFSELVEAFARIGVLSFGGAAGQIALMHRVVVEEKRWLDEPRYLHALNYCMLLPGPEAQQLATYIGWLLHGVRGGLAAGLLFILPGAAVMLGLALLYAFGTGMALVDGVFYGVKAAVLAIIAQALWGLSKRALTAPLLIGLAAAAFAAMALLGLPFPVVILGAAAVGAAMAAPDVVEAGPAPQTGAATGESLRMAAICLAAWWAPIALAALAGATLLTDLGLFFSKLAILTFGGAYAVLAWLAQEGVAAGWASTGQMVDGLALAETTPGPTILVNQFVGYLAGHGAGGPVLGVAGAAMALWATFAPSFLWIFAGAPHVEALRRAPRLAGALKGVTAAVVGVIAYVAVWFGSAVLLRPARPVDAWPSPDLAALALTALAAMLLFGLKLGVLRTVGAMAAAGVALRIAGLV